MIESWLAKWVSTQMQRFVGPRSGTPDKTLYSASTWDESYFNLDGDWAQGTAIEQQDLHYIPYESDPEKMINGYKKFPGTSEYVDYQLDKNLAERLDLNFSSGNLNKHELAELKFGFYALVSKKYEKLSQRPSEVSIEDQLADQLFSEFFFQQYNAIGSDASNPGGGGHVAFGSSTGTRGEHDLSTDEGVRAYIEPTADIKEEIHLLNERLWKETRLQAQLVDENIPCIDYYLVGDWNPAQSSAIMAKMKDPAYQSVIKEKSKLGHSRITLENFMFILLGPTPADAITADTLYRTKANAGNLCPVNREQEKYSNVDFLKREIERLGRRAGEILKQREDAEQRAYRLF